jgi:hypothetical protein
MKGLKGGEEHRGRDAREAAAGTHTTCGFQRYLLEPVGNILALVYEINPERVQTRESYDESFICYVLSR